MIIRLVGQGPCLLLGQIGAKAPSFSGHPSYGLLRIHQPDSKTEDRFYPTVFIFSFGHSLYTNLNIPRLP